MEDMYHQQIMQDTYEQNMRNAYQGRASPRQYDQYQAG